MECINFRGRSGRLTGFTRMSVESGWSRKAGVALFAARDTYGWRVIRMVEMTGRVHDVQPFWAQLDAERCGARAIFIHHEGDHERRRAIMADLEAGLNPVFPMAAAPMPVQMAA